MQLLAFFVHVDHCLELEGSAAVERFVFLFFEELYSLGTSLIMSLLLKYWNFFVAKKAKTFFVL